MIQDVVRIGRVTRMLRGS